MDTDSDSENTVYTEDLVRIAKCKLYDADRALARKQQGSDSAILDTLDKLHGYIAEYGHPYDLYSFPCRTIVSKIGEDNTLTHFHRSANGYKARLRSEDGYLYRLVAHNNLFRTNSPGQWNLTAPAFERNALDADYGRMYQHLIKKSADAQDPWLSLADYATGAVATPRHHSFWSDYKPAHCNPSYQKDLSKLTRHAYRVGLPSNYIPEQMHVLRCKKTDAVPLIHVPTAVDAFDFTVFYPTALSNGPVTGKAINLTEIGRYVSDRDSQRTERIQHAIKTRQKRLLVANEYTLKPVPVEYIEILPVKYTLTRDPKLMQDNLYGVLKDLYVLWGTAA